MDGLYDLLQRRGTLTDTGRDSFFDFWDNYCSPGYWTAYAGRARARNLTLEQLEIPFSSTLGYAKAIAIDRALGQQDTYPYQRRNAGGNYSPLVLLETQEQTDAAVSEINSCIRRIFQERRYGVFASKMCELVGDLLDNVWSHGKATGFSMAQKWKNGQTGFNFEFAVADCGLGFLRELKRAGIHGVETDQEALAWCIQRGNSTKKREIDEWEQRLPGDMMGNPMPNVGRVVESDNHHMGLGLAKLVDDVERFGGQLWLASGDAMLVIREDGSRSYVTNSVFWHGVALACRFDTDRVTIQDAAPPAEDELTRILNELLGGA